eukprot:1400022-Rhodomonas_salina.1
MGQSWIIDAGRALFNAMKKRQEHCQTNGLPFSPSDFSSAGDDYWLNALTERASNKVISLLGVIRAKILKDTFGSNFTKHVESGFADAAALKEAQDVAIEDFLKDASVFLLKSLQDAAFPTQKERESCSVHKEQLRSILFTSEIVNFLEGTDTTDISGWYAKPWLQYAIAAWCKILWYYEGLSSRVDVSLIQDFNEVAAAGIGKKKVNINEIKRKLETMLAPAPKQFTDVQ